MTMLSERVDVVIGVDTHTDTHTAALVSAAGGVLATLSVESTEDGYGKILDAIIALDPAHTRDTATGIRVAWAIEGTGSYGAGLTRILLEAGAEVIEVRSARRPRGQGKNDTNDAVAIARAALCEHTHAQPRTGDTREALRILTVTRDQDVRTRTRQINAFKSLVLQADPAIRGRLRELTTTEQIAAATLLRTPRKATEAVTACVAALRARATSIRALSTAIDKAEKEMVRLTTTHAAPLLEPLGVGAITAAQILLSYSHHGRFANEAAFAAMAGTSPLEASSGRTVRHRLNRTGDRKLNAAIHRIILTRKTRKDPATIAYIERRTAAGKTPKEIDRVLKRYVTRQLFKILQALPAMP